MVHRPVHKDPIHRVIYTDGSARGNPGPAGCAWFYDGNIYQMSLPNKATNNYAELMAVWMAVKDLPAGSYADIYTDSETVTCWLTHSIPCQYELRNQLWELSVKNDLHLMIYRIKRKSDWASNAVDKAAKAASQTAGRNFLSIKTSLREYLERHERPQVEPDDDDDLLATFLMGMYPGGLK